MKKSLGKIAIDRNIPLPNFTIGKGNNIKFPLQDMNIGDSFKVSKVDIVSVRVIMSRFHKATPLRFVSRALDRAGQSYRVWRVK